jgi:hypothetical protein
MSKMPSVIACRCSHKMLTKDYDMQNWPDKNTPADMIYESHNPNEASYSVLCPTCAHYTVNRPPKKNQ